ncbi:restriction endonuclease subunit S [Leucothrix pacifica]|uniref:Type I restriction modification DNA specificity domain-containing protein n=1 Tax=Leucothrix pacifica TaxID=1247513 RepID=A0A317CEK3_9GAMM|nr:restriction endonuclease subunit S [Leucothrix pacifica]PWQ97094.1 hypothetical protein DKW60_11070 [Leucothrix pacifica]
MGTKNLVLAHKLIGEIPKDWKYIDFHEIYLKPIRDFGSFSSTKLITFLSEGIPFIKSEMIKEGIIDWENVSYISEDVHKVLNKSYVTSNTILFSKIGSALGKAVVYEGELGECNSNAAVAKILLDDEKADRYFYTYLLNNPIAKRQFIRMVISLLPRINLGDINSLIFPYPPLPEQRKIAKILSTWDKAINTTERLIDNSKQQKKALMQQLLTGKKRLLDDSRRVFEGEWEEVRLGQITEFIKDGTHGTHKRYETGIPMLSAANITKSHKISFKGAPFISGNDYKKIHSKYEISSGDILLTVVGTLGRVAIVSEDRKFTLQRSVAIIRVSNKADNQFLMQLFSSNDFNHLLVRKSNSTAQAGVYLGELARIKILLPPIEEQHKIASVFTNADQEIERLEQQLADLKQEKKALMQQLLTGKRRVKLDDTAAA